MTIVEQLADTWRWWTAPGALVGIILLWPRAAVLLESLRHRRPETGTILPAKFRLSTTLAAIAFMVGVLIAGAIIPLATDGRVADFTRESPLYHHTMAAVWLLWGSACWGIAVSLSASWRWMAAASVVLWWAALVATQETMGAAL